MDMESIVYVTRHTKLVRGGTNPTVNKYHCLGWKGLVQSIIKVSIVGEYNMTTNIKQESLIGCVCRG